MMATAGKAINMKILVTGAAGFIGSYVCQALQKRNIDVLGLDNFNDYYDPQLKHDRVRAVCPDTEIVHLDLVDPGPLSKLFEKHRFSGVIHLAAQAGVRYSLENPGAYVQSNLLGFANLLECSRRYKVSHTVYASSSSVYGGSGPTPSREDQRIDRPVSFYAATKAANELMAHSYAQLYQLPLTGLRLFTVYGEWGRPDMAPVLFSRAILEQKPIQIFNHGKMKRDFTHIDDIVDGVIRAYQRPPGESDSLHRIFNLGNDQPTSLMDFIQVIENTAGREAEKQYLPLQPGEVVETAADISLARELLGFEPKGRLETELPKVFRWCERYYQSRPAA